MAYIISGHDPRNGLRGSPGSLSGGMFRGTSGLGAASVSMAQLAQNAATAAGIGVFSDLVLNLFTALADSGRGFSVGEAANRVKAALAAGTPATQVVSTIVQSVMKGTNVVTPGPSGTNIITRPDGTTNIQTPGGGITAPPGGDGGGGFGFMSGLGGNQTLILGGAAALLVGALVLGRRKGKA